MRHDAWSMSGEPSHENRAKTMSRDRFREQVNARMLKRNHNCDDRRLVQTRDHCKVSTCAAHAAPPLLVSLARPRSLVSCVSRAPCVSHPCSLLPLLHLGLIAATPSAFARVPMPPPALLVSLFPLRLTSFPASLNDSPLRLALSSAECTQSDYLSLCLSSHFTSCSLCPPPSARSSFPFSSLPLAGHSPTLCSILRVPLSSFIL